MTLNSHKPRILLIDDEPLLLEMMGDILSNKGYEVTKVSNAKDAIKLLKLSSFEILITDVLLEDLDGFEISLVAKKFYPEIIPILTTGAPNPIDAQRAKVNNFFYLPKPLDLDSLNNIIESGLENISFYLKNLKAA